MFTTFSQYYPLVNKQVAIEHGQLQSFIVDLPINGCDLHKNM